MTDSCFTAQTVTKQLIIDEIRQLMFQRNDSRQYTHVAVTQLVKGIQQVLKQQYNPAVGSNSMIDLLNQNNKGPQANKTTTAEEVLCKLQNNAVDESVKTGTIIVPEFKLCADAKYKAGVVHGWVDHFVTL
jgi:hypothetical protein